MSRRVTSAVVVAGVVLLGSACGGPASGSTRARGSVTVLAAASLTEVFNAEKQAFVRAHPGVGVTLAFAGSTTLVAQVEQGAPADVIATADPPSLDRLARAGLLAGSARVFSRNRLEIVVERGNPRRVTGLADLARPGLAVVLGAETLPAGRYARAALALAGVVVHPVSLEDDVKAIVTKVALGEADAGIVYATDVRGAGSRVSGVPIPAASNIVADYPIAVLRGSGHAALARSFAAFVRSSAGRRILERFGFLPA